MPIKDSAKKEMRKTAKRTAANSQRKRKIKDLLKKIRQAAQAGRNEEAKNMLPRAYALLDKAAKKKIIHPNKASRSKSRLQKFISKATVK